MDLCRACLDPECTALTHGGKTPRGYPQYLSLPLTKSKPESEKEDGNQQESA